MCLFTKWNLNVFTLLCMATAFADAMEGNDTLNHIEHELMERLLIKYYKNVRPYPCVTCIEPTVVNISIFIRSISAIDEFKMEYTTDVILRQYWVDPRFNMAKLREFWDANLTYLHTEPSIVDRVWVPDIYFPTLRRGNTVDIALPNMFFRIYPNGTVLYSIRYSLTLACDMNLRKYPFDEQECPLIISSFGSSADKLVLNWTPEYPIIRSEDLQLPKFILKAIRKVDKWPCNLTNSHNRTADKSCIQAKLILTREIKYHVVETFLPTTLLVVSSWLGFWIDATVVPARVSLGVTSMLTTISLGSNIRYSLPPVSYIKAIDVWLGMCICFVFASLLEFGIVNFLVRNPRASFNRFCFIGFKFRKSGPISTATENTEGEKVCEQCNKTPQICNGSAQLDTTDLTPSTVSLDSEKGFVFWRILRKEFGKRKRKETDKNKMSTSEQQPPLTNYQIIDICARVLFPLAFLVLSCAYTFYYFDFDRLTELRQENCTKLGRQGEL